MISSYSHKFCQSTYDLQENRGMLFGKKNLYWAKAISPGYGALRKVYISKLVRISCKTRGYELYIQRWKFSRMSPLYFIISNNQKETTLEISGRLGDMLKGSTIPKQEIRITKGYIKGKMIRKTLLRNRGNMGKRVAYVG